ncbi:MAG: FAD-binding oxidoreductase [Aquincola sp.]|nr:FAD-binding oxidoreductase [Aquincola sp.]MDH4287422.1 FAD-binding oxidoreductase [Aquincola sp.]MDH5328386.1 FAD-binding oxidoreductase [Aquincola sp.]
MPFLETDRELARHSYYAATAPRQQAWPALAPGAHRCDVAVVGAGFAGLTAAIELRQRGLDVVLLEGQEVGSGASGRNGGQAIYGLACDIAAIEGELGLDDARRVFAMTLEAVDDMRRRIREFGIDCDWRDGHLAVATSARKARALHDEVEQHATRYDHPMTWIERADLPQWIASPRYVAGAHDTRSGHLHPLRYALGLARAADAMGVRVHEGSVVSRIARDGDGVTLTTTAAASLHARHVLLAGNVYLDALAPALAPRLGARVMPVGTYIVSSRALAPEQAKALIPCGAAVCDNNFVLDYFRTTADHRMLYGGRVSYSTRTPMSVAGSMVARMTKTFPQLRGVEAEFAWGGFVDISMSRAPDFGRLAEYGDRVYYLQGFSGHGVALTGLAGKLVAEAIAGDATRFDVFARLQHHAFPGGRALRTPALVLGMAYYRLKDLL